jgi:general secretion pathway protein M
MRDWFESMEQREQVFVAAGAVIVCIALVYAFIWSPLDTGQKTASASVNSWQRSLAELKPLANTQTAGSASPRGVQQTPVVIVDQTLRARGLDRSLKRSQPTSSNGIRVEFENVAFDDLVLWLGDLSNQHRMQVTTGSMSTTTEAAPGRVNATFTLERA